MTTTPLKVREPKPGDVLGGHYVLESELGRGGFGVVFRARHVEIQRQVAIKVLLTTYANRDPTAVARFRREAQIAASLSYPNSVQLFDYGETDEGIFYIVMEYLEGKPLADIIAREGAMHPVRAVHVVRQVLHALMEAHAKGIVHRDIKPDNIMLTPLSYDPDFVKVMDFGIAKMVSGEGSLTAAGLTLGTPRYMPVEQLKGQELAPSSDLYAVGIVMYEMLTGHPAIQADSLVEVAARIIDGRSVELPAGGGVPPQLAAVVNKAAYKDAEGRFQTAREFLEALEEWVPTQEMVAELETQRRQRRPHGPRPLGLDDPPVKRTQILAEASDGDAPGPTVAMPAMDDDDGRGAPRVDHAGETIALSTGIAAGKGETAVIRKDAVAEAAGHEPLRARIRRAHERPAPSVGASDPDIDQLRIAGVRFPTLVLSQVVLSAATVVILLVLLAKVL